MPTKATDYIGELNVRLIEGRFVMSYCDGWRWVVTRTSPSPTGDWSVPKVQVVAKNLSPVPLPVFVPQQSNLYAPTIHPQSTLANTHLYISTWDKEWYGVYHWAVDVNGSFPAPIAYASRSAGDGNNKDEIVVDQAAGLYKLPVEEKAAILAENADDDITEEVILAGLRDDRVIPAPLPAASKMTE